MCTITVSVMFMAICLVARFSITVADEKSECLKGCWNSMKKDPNLTELLCNKATDPNARFTVWPINFKCGDGISIFNVLCSPKLYSFVHCLQGCEKKTGYSHNIMYLASYLCKIIADIKSGYGCIDNKMDEQEYTCSLSDNLSDKSLMDYCIYVHAIRGCHLPYIKEKCGRKAIDAYVALFALNANFRAYDAAIFGELGDNTVPAECTELMTGGIGPVPKTTLKPTDEVATSTVIEFPTTTNNDTALNETEDTEDSDPFGTTPNSGPIKHAFHISGIFLGCILALFWTG